MTERDDDFRRLVPMLPGWTLSEPDGNLVKTLRAFRRADYASFPLPAVGAPLPEQLEFVGRIAVVMWSLKDARAWGLESVRFPSPIEAEVTLVSNDDFVTRSAPDLAWAAVKAALACRTVTQ